MLPVAPLDGSQIFGGMISKNNPQLAIIPIPYVCIGILDPFITSIRAKQAFTSPPGDDINIFKCEYYFDV